MITVKELQALTAQDNGRRVSFGESLYGTVRTSQDNAVSLHVVWRYKVGGKARQAYVGTWRAGSGGKSLKELREIKNSMAGNLKMGIDPIHAKETDRIKKQADQIEAKQSQVDRLQELAAKDARITVRALFEVWRDLDLKKRKDGGSEALRAFERDVFPNIGTVAVQDVTKAHVQLIIDKMKDRGVNRMAERVFSDLRQLFGFALDRDHIETDPTARIKKHKIGGSVERDRVLAEAELIELFKKLPASGLTATAQNALLIQLSTAARIGEVLGARWENVDFERQAWTLPTSKNGRRHVVFLNAMAMRAFEALRQHSGQTAWVFPNSHLNGPVCSKTVTKQVADRQRGNEPPMRGRTKQSNALALAAGQWRPHDLRRTGATIMAELGVLPEVIERSLNHVEQSKIKRIYQRPQYEAPLRDAWQRLGNRLDALYQQAPNDASLTPIQPRLPGPP